MIANDPPSETPELEDPEKAAAAAKFRKGLQRIRELDKLLMEKSEVWFRTYIVWLSVSYAPSSLYLDRSRFKESKKIKIKDRLE